VAGGSGSRFGGAKQFASLGDVRVVDASMAVASAASAGVVLVVPADDVEREGGVAGGATRSASVRAGLALVPDEADIICVHDAARPLATVALYQRVVSAIEAGADAAIPGVEVTDTIKQIDGNGKVIATPPRSTLRAVQTPQAFRASVLRRAHEGDPEATDDAALVEAAGGVVVVVDGEADNRKLTLPEDLEWARSRRGTGA
jgi:2-C-methyl-D-erythritol 4-phosphate cytidylyltransferase